MCGFDSCYSCLIGPSKIIISDTHSKFSLTSVRSSKLRKGLHALQLFNNKTQISKFPLLNLLKFFTPLNHNKRKIKNLRYLLHVSSPSTQYISKFFKTEKLNLTLIRFLIFNQPLPNPFTLFQSSNSTLRTFFCKPLGTASNEKPFFFQVSNWRIENTVSRQNLRFSKIRTKNT